MGKQTEKWHDFLQRSQHKLWVSFSNVFPYFFCAAMLLNKWFASCDAGLLVQQHCHV